MKKRLWLVISAVLLICALLPLGAAARDWWTMEADYILQDRPPVEETGSYSRIFLPRVKAQTVDGIAMEMTYQVTRGGEVLAEGDYAEETSFDLIGAGTYVFTLKGVDASNAYTFEVRADDTLASFVADAPVPTQIKLTEAFSAPAAKLIWQGSEQPAEISLTMADGAVYRYEEKAVPQTGLMTVCYSTSFEGQTQERTFAVDVLDDTLGFYDESGSFYPAGTQALENDTLCGAVLNGTSTRNYTFSKLLNLSAATKDDPLIVLNNAAPEAERVVPKLRIVDARDSKNYIEIQGRWSADNADMVYSVAAAAGQSLVGHLGGESFYNGASFGTETNFPTSSQVGKEHPAIFSYDAEEKAVYAGWYGEMHLIADFDADYQLRTWNGFTTAEVYLVVERGAENDFLCVESVAGQSLADAVRNEDAPVILLDAEDEVPYAIAGAAYPLPEATACDAFEGILPVELHVFKGSDATSGVEMNVEDGVFTPFDAGYYTAVYSAQDSYGNAVLLKRNILAVNAQDAPAVTAEISGLPETAYVGEEILLPKPRNITGGSGNVTCTVKLISPDGSETPLTDKSFVLTAEGSNIVEYDFTDYLGITQSFRFTIQAVPATAPILYELQMPESLMSGKTFRIPEAQCAQQADVTVTATLDGAPLEVLDGTVTPVTDGRDAELKLIYTAKDEKGTSCREYVIPIYGHDGTDRTSYFRAVQGEFAAVQKDGAIAFTTAQTDSALRFINSVLADKLTVTLSLATENNGCDRITLFVSDAQNPDIRVRFDLAPQEAAEDGKLAFYINGTRVNDLTAETFDGVATVALTYQASAASVTDSARATLGKITQTVSGEAFDGFPSGEATLTFACETSGEGSFEIQKINNQVFSGGDAFFDNYPELSVNGALPLQAKVGDTLTLPSAFAADVLSANVDVTLSVRRGTETILEDLSARTENELTLDTYGTYYVTYRYTDGSAERSMACTVQTMETEPPTVELPKLPKSGKVGQRITLALPGVSDAHSQTLRVSVIVREPNYNLFKLSEDALFFVPERAGTYTVYFYVSDECNNYQIVAHEIVVKD